MEMTVLFGFVISLCMGLGALSVFVWAIFSRQLEDTEDVKFRVLQRELDDDQLEG